MSNLINLILDSYNNQKMRFKIYYNKNNNFDDIYLEKEWRSNIYIYDIDNNMYYNPTFMTLNRIKSECDGKLSYYFEENLVIVERIDQESLFNVIANLLDRKNYISMVSMSFTQVETFLKEINEFDHLEIEVKKK